MLDFSVPFLVSLSDESGIRIRASRAIRNKHDSQGLSWQPAILSPSPRAWPVKLGAADLPIGCALNFFATASNNKKMAGDKPRP
jgi:hypothetical protein